MGLSLRLAPLRAFHHLAPLRAFRIISPHSGPFTSSRPTQGLSHHLAPLRAFHIISPHSGPSTSSRPAQGLPHLLAPHSGPSTSFRPAQGLPHPFAPLRAFHIISPRSGPSTSFFFFFFWWWCGVLLLITRLLASPVSCCELSLQVVFCVPRQNRHNLVTRPYVDILRRLVKLLVYQIGVLLNTRATKLAAFLLYFTLLSGWQPAIAFLYLFFNLLPFFLNPKTVLYKFGVRN